PHSCALYEDPDKITSELVELQVGAPSDQTDRIDGKPITVGGAKGYRYVDKQAGHCRIMLPTSFTLAIGISDESATDDDDSCQAVSGHAERVAELAAEPEHIAVDHDDRPLSAWDGC